MLNQLLETKFHIQPPPPDLVTRSRLLQTMDDACARPCKLILVSAPAGYGKTTLITTWLRRTPRSAAWLALDQDDNIPERFWKYVIAALQTFDPALGQTAQAALESPQSTPLTPLVSTLINDLNRFSQPIVLILDDYHLLSNESIHASLDFLLERLPLEMRVVIVTRMDPPLALARLQARSQLVQVRAEDLRFNLAETEEYLNTCMQLGLSRQDVIALAERTDGWIVGLHLAAFSLRQQADRSAFIAAFAGDDRYVMDYLLEEVLQRQPVAVQDFLLRTSIMRRFCAPVCEAVSGNPDSQAILAYLEDANLFVEPLDSRRGWYRYHPLFADLLKRRLYQTLAASECILLHRKATAWFEKIGLLVCAIHQSMAGNDYELTAELLLRHGLTLFFHGAGLLLKNWLKALPQETLCAHPLLCVIYANTIAHTNYFQPDALQLAEHWLQEAEQALTKVGAPASAPEQAPQPEGELAKCFLALTRAYLACWRGEAPQKVIDLARKALADLPPPDQAHADPNFLRFRSGLNNNLGQSYLKMGDFTAAEKAFAQAQQIGETCGDLLNTYAAISARSNLLRRQGRLHEAATLCQATLEAFGRPGQPAPASIPYANVVYISLGQILLEWNNLDQAENMLQKGLALNQLLTGCDFHLEGYLTLARIKQIRGDMPGALDTLDQCSKYCSQTGALIAIHRVRLWLMQAQGQPNLPDAAVQWAQGRQLDDTLSDPTSGEALALTRLLIHQYRVAVRASTTKHPDLNRLLAFVERQIQAAETGGWIERQIEWIGLQALALQVCDDDSNRACASLRQALALADPGGYLRLFLDEGQPMRWLLEAFRLSLGKPASDSDAELGRRMTAYVDRILAAFPAATPGLPASAVGLSEPLSAREVEVLYLLGAGATNAEIARKLSITVNTVKKHVTHIFEKLSVTTRQEAAAQAGRLRPLQ